MEQPLLKCAHLVQSDTTDEEVLDNEELAVLRLATEQGGSRICGFSDSFQWHTLLADALNGEGDVPYPAPALGGGKCQRGPMALKTGSELECLMWSTGLELPKQAQIIGFGTKAFPTRLCLSKGSEWF